jgi:PadR family transcriptional regulator PadR
VDEYADVFEGTGIDADEWGRVPGGAATTIRVLYCLKQKMIFFYEPDSWYCRIPCIAMYRTEEIDKKITQLRKGILELAILSALNRKTHYGYSLVRSLTAAGTIDLKEGTIYPILSRLAKEGLVRTEWVESRQGPPRKYYSLTRLGQVTCEALNAEFQRLVGLVDEAGQNIQNAPEKLGARKIILGSQDDE